MEDVCFDTGTNSWPTPPPEVDLWNPYPLVTDPPGSCIIQCSKYTIASDVRNVVIIGNNTNVIESDKIYIGNTVWDNKKDNSDPEINVLDIIGKLEKRVTDLQDEVNLLREMITWHPNNIESISQLKEHFESLAHSHVKKYET